MTETVTTGRAAAGSASQTFASKLKERREQVKMDHTALAGLLDVPVQTLVGWESGAVSNLTFDQLGTIARVLGTTIGELSPEADSDLNNGVLIQLPQDQSVLKAVRGEHDYYTYHCLVRTATVPSMVPLVVDVLVDDPDQAKFNEGHAGNEFIYVLEGEIHMKWGDPNKPNEAVLPTGSSLYLKPFVPHAFTATKDSGPARLVAVNF